MDGTTFAATHPRPVEVPGGPDGRNGPSRPRQSSLKDRYELEEGTVFLSGVQALVRLLLDQHRADARAGWRTATLASGYPGSPLGGLDQELARLGQLGSEHEIVLRPAVNEELGATAVWGSQLSPGMPGARHEGVLGVWYGKAPGVDRAADAIRHGNYVGASPRGGLLALCGDDPACKSSTIPGASESLLAALQVPVLVPGSVQEVLDLGRHAIACSRASGLWAGMKIVTNVADATGTVEVGLDRVQPVVPVMEWEGRPYVHAPSAHLLAPQSLQMEQSLFEVRLELARSYGQVNRLNRTIVPGHRARLGVVAAGATAHDARRALLDLGLDEAGPVRLFQVGMLYPFDGSSLIEFARGLEEILVLEEKGQFLERLVKDALYGSGVTPPVVGKRDQEDRPLVPAHGTLNVDSIAEILGTRLLARVELPSVRAGLERLAEQRARPAVSASAVRTPFFCSGCPHNRSTVAPPDALVGAGIGCHTMVMLAPSRHGTVSGVTQMGGEGAQWIGVAPFAEIPHVLQNLGDGTFHHSGSLAIRAAVAAGLNVTYKLLVNGHVSMTGGQEIAGGLPVPAIAASLSAEGVSRIVITTDDPAKLSGSELPVNASVRHRDELEEVQRELAAVTGVTVLLHDQACAAELRRERKRGRAPDPPERVAINERVCEGCGDCGERSGCLSVEPMQTEFGRKTRINDASCNKDYSCLQGDCPSFVTVIHKPQGRPPVRWPEIELPEPELQTSRETRIRLVGIGGTGVVTVSQVLGMAALLDGRHATGLDQTGLSQKAGPVVSDIHISDSPLEDGVGVPSGSVDVLLGLDMVGAASSSNLAAASAARTVAVVSESIAPTGQMVLDPAAPTPDVGGSRQAIDAFTRSEANVYLNAQLIAERLIGDGTPANVVVLGAAWQSGVVPVSLSALEEAFRLNGVAVERNLAALAWGRAWVVNPEVVREQLAPPALPALSPRARDLVNRVPELTPELRRLVEIRAADLIGWGGTRAARAYVDEVGRVHAAEVEALGSTQLTQAVARGLHKLMAYKDEYEVARLHLESLDSLPAGATIKFHLHPPLLRTLGLQRKLKLGRWFIPVFRLLRSGRRLRGTPLDPFGYARVRRTERALVGEYMTLVNRALEQLGPETYPVALQVAALPELVRGYEEIKLAAVARFRAAAEELARQLQ